jgi:hypothetical protein
MLLLSSCEIQVYKLPHDSFCYSDTDTVVELEIEEKEYIINLLNEGKWHPDVAKCTTDYNFYTQKQSLGYNAEEGIFNDFTLSRSLKLSEEDRIAVNLYLGYKDADETPLTPSPDKTYSFEEIYNLSSYINLDEITSIKIDYNGGYLGRAMMHDVGKPYCKAFIDGKGNPCETAHFYQHQCLSASIAYGLYGDSVPVDVAWLCSVHMDPYLNTKYYNKLPTYLKKQVDLLHECDQRAH